MNTIFIIKEILSFYAKKMSNSSIEKQNKYKDELVTIMTKLIDLYPYLLHPISHPYLTEKEAFNIIEKIKKEVDRNYVPLFPSHLKYTDVIEENVIETPVFETCENNYKQVYYKDITNYLLNMLLCIPINKLNITFVEIGNELVGDFFYKNINPKIYKQNRNTNKIPEIISPAKGTVVYTSCSFNPLRLSVNAPAESAATKSPNAPIMLPASPFAAADTIHNATKTTAAIMARTNPATPFLERFLL